MSDDAGRGRSAGVPAHGPAHGNVGPADPGADPATDPGMRLPVPADQPTAPVAATGTSAPAEPDAPTAGAPAPGRTGGRAAAVRRSRTGVVWVGLIFSALVLLLLLVFILQNDAPVQIAFFTFQGVLPSGVALLLAAIMGVLLGAVPGSLRIFQLRRAARRSARQNS